MRQFLTFDHTNAPQPTRETREMYEPLRLSNTDHLVVARIHELRGIAAELRPMPRTGGEPMSLVERTRAVIGRRLVSLGGAVAGQHA